MNLQIVDFETAKKLKKLEWPQVKDLHPTDVENTYEFYPNGEVVLNGSCSEAAKEIWIAPYQAEVCKWFRDVHNIMTELTYDTIKKTWDADVYSENDGQLKCTDNHEEYEDAELEAIKKGIEILKNK